MTKKWLENLLNKRKIKISDVFLLTSDNKGNYYLIEREKIGKN